MSNKFHITQQKNMLITHKFENKILCISLLNLKISAIVLFFIYQENVFI